MSKSRRDNPAEPSLPEAGAEYPAEPTSAPAKEKRQYAKELDELRKAVAGVLGMVELADDPELNLPPDTKATLYQRAIARLRGLV